MRNSANEDPMYTRHTRLAQSDELLMHDRGNLQGRKLPKSPDWYVEDISGAISDFYEQYKNGTPRDLPGDMLWPDQHTDIFRTVASLPASARETLAKKLLERNPALVVYALPLFMYDPFIGDLLKQATSADSERFNPKEIIIAAKLFVDNYHVFHDMSWAAEVYRHITSVSCYEQTARAAALVLPHQIEAVLAGRDRTPHAPNLLGAYEEDLRADLVRTKVDEVIQGVREARNRLRASAGMTEDGGEAELAMDKSPDGTAGIGVSPSVPDAAQNSSPSRPAGEGGGLLSGLGEPGKGPWG